MSKNIIDINDIRNPQIKAHSLSVDQSYTFYYDETNNIRRLYINDNGMNVTELKPFILGGVAHKSDKNIDLSDLRHELKIQSNVQELKLKHICRGDFSEILESDRLNTILEWLLNEKLFVHYHCLHPFYWAIVDIIDSILILRPELYHLHLDLKATLFNVLKLDVNQTSRIFKRYHYPNLQRQDRAKFLMDIADVVEACNAENYIEKFGEDFLLMLLLMAKKSDDELTFIEGFLEGELIENFFLFYLNRIALFKNSSHILDEEPNIQGLFNKIDIVDKSTPVSNFIFCDSITKPGIQLSDIIVGIIGKMYSFICSKNESEINFIKKNMSSKSKENLIRLKHLIDISDDENQAFFQHVSSVEDIKKKKLLFDW